MKKRNCWETIKTIIFCQGNVHGLMNHIEAKQEIYYPNLLLIVEPRYSLSF